MGSLPDPTNIYALAYSLSGVLAILLVLKVLNCFLIVFCLIYVHRKKRREKAEAEYSELEEEEEAGAIAEAELEDVEDEHASMLPLLSGAPVLELDDSISPPEPEPPSSPPDSPSTIDSSAIPPSPPSAPGGPLGYIAYSSVARQEMAEGRLQVSARQTAREKYREMVRNRVKNASASADSPAASDTMDNPPLAPRPVSLTKAESSVLESQTEGPENAEFALADLARVLGGSGSGSGFDRIQLLSLLAQSGEQERDEKKDENDDDDPTFDFGELRKNSALSPDFESSLLPDEERGRQDDSLQF